ncbi:hypothetical protein QE109_05875 [Fusibacter bizertensis]|uniref:Pilus assembly protein n=2 Tax=Fusibacter bizertensis TaxID=1488331 RepID=A0ABT6NBA2_9FIRM|nr:hypothetical protein [Fusibacter bizertensis]
MMKKDEGGSIALEAIVTFPIMMIIMITLFGTLISYYVDERVTWSALNTRDEMSLYSMPFMGHEKIIQEKINTNVLNELSKTIFKKEIHNKGIENLVKIISTKIEFDGFGFAQFEIKYQYKLLSLNRVKQIYIPLSAAAVSDGEQFKEATVYITTYGEKYHKADCFHLRKSKFGIVINLAKEKGYTACKNCYDFVAEER